MDRQKFVVVCEVCRDFLAHSLSRPGGAAYSAYAGTKIGAHVSIVGHMGVDRDNNVLQTLDGLGIDTGYIQRVPGPITTYILSNVDEVLPLAATVKQNTFPVSPSPVYPGADVALFYPYPNLDEYLERWPNACRGLDVQYDLDSIFAMTDMSCLDVVFVSSSDVVTNTGLNLDRVVRTFLDKGAGVVVTKYGPGGSSIYRNNKKRIDIPAFTSNYQWTVGAGDVYNAVFLLSYAHTSDLEISGRHASLAAATFMEEFVFVPGLWDFDMVSQCRGEQFLHPDKARSIRIYLAAPFFSWGERIVVNQTYCALENCGFNVFSPLHATGIVGSIGEQRKAFRQNLEQLGCSDLVVALTDYEDPGTVWECGYACSKGIPIYMLHTADRNPSFMVRFGSEIICESLRCLVDRLYGKFGGRP